jgi:hypothetical protein
MLITLTDVQTQTTSVIEVSRNYAMVVQIRELTH